MRRRACYCIIVGVGLMLGGGAAFAQEAMKSDPSYPAPGHVYEVQFGGQQFRLNYDPNGKEMTYTRPDGSGDTVQYTAIEVRPNVFMVYWIEPKSGTHVTHVEDFERGIMYVSNVRKDGRFIHAKSPLKRVQ